MVRFFRKARARYDKFPEALQWAHGVRDHLNANYPEISLQVFMEAFGDVNTIYWSMDYENMLEAEAANTRLMADQKYWGMLAEGAGLFVEATGVDKLLVET